MSINIPWPVRNLENSLFEDNLFAAAGQLDRKKARFVFAKNKTCFALKQDRFALNSTFLLDYIRLGLFHRNNDSFTLLK